MELSPTSQVFATPELLEPILLCLLSQLETVSDREDPRSARTHDNAGILKHLLSLHLIDRSFNALLSTSVHLKRALFVTPDVQSSRSWVCDTNAILSESLGEYYGVPMAGKAPLLNPMVQTTFPSYHFRFWHLSLEATGNRYCAYLILTREDIATYRTTLLGGENKILDRMLLSQPPITTLEAMIWDERDETKDYIGRTSALEDSFIECESGLTVGEVHRKVGAMFARHTDVPAIKLTTA